MVTLVTEELKRTVYIRFAPARLSVVGNQEVEIKGYEIVEDGIGSKLMLEANWIKEMMWLVDCHSWMEVALSLWLINVKTEIDLTLGSARFIDTIVWGQDIDFTTA